MAPSRAPSPYCRDDKAYWITCTDFVTDDAGNVTEIHCTYDPLTKCGDSPPPDADANVRKVKGTPTVSHPNGHAYPCPTRQWHTNLSTH